jgi:hypothetical protein
MGTENESNQLLTKSLGNPDKVSGFGPTSQPPPYVLSFQRAQGDPTMSEPSQFLLYTAPDGAVKVEVFFQNETVWLTQKALAELFGVKVPAINKHLKNIFDSGELNENSVVSILETTAADGKKYATRFYNLGHLELVR